MELEDKIRYNFKNRSLLTQALTHSSYAQKGENNERLEFLGDAVLELVISEYLYKRLNLSEGRMTKLRANIVCAESLAMAATDIDLGSALRLGKGERNTGGASRRSNLANAFEAVIGAIFLDSDYKTVQEVVLRLLGDNIEKAVQGRLMKDYKTELQEIVQKTPGRTLRYADLGASGPDHDRIFKTELFIDGESVSVGEGKTKKEAEQEAAKQAYLHEDVQALKGKH